jgi:arylsulfatase A-like enzyme
MRPRTQWKFWLSLVVFGWVAACGPTDLAEETAADSVEETAVLPDDPAFEVPIRPKNLLFIAFDTTRLDRIVPELAPNLSAVLGESVVFPKHQACSNWTYFSFGCVLVGQSNIAQGWVPMEFGNLGSDQQEVSYPDSPEMLAERFGAAGFQTALVGSHPFLSPDLNLFQGYETRRIRQPGDADQVVELALNEMPSLLTQDSPWLLHVHFDDPHLPYKARPFFMADLESLPETAVDFTSRDLLTILESRWPQLNAEERQDVLVNLNAYYNGEVSFMDFHFGKLWSQLKESGALEDTLVVLFSDHGEQFFEHGQFGHRASLHSEETSALLGFWHADLPAKTANWATANEDILPTLLSIFELPGVDGGGRPLNELNELDPAPVFAVHGAHDNGVKQSVRMGSDLLIYNWRGAAERFELEVDSGERENKMGEDPDLEAGLMALLAPQIEALAVLLPETEPVPLP